MLIIAMLRPLFILFALVATVFSSANAAIIYVNAARPNDSGNGLSWATAKKTFQAGINAANAGDQVWVAAGTYFPTQNLYNGSNPADNTFILKDGVSFYGGFNATENSLSQRNFANNITSLNGNNANSNVVVAAGTIGIRIDGFHITGGQAAENYTMLNGQLVMLSGGGISISGGNNIIQNNKIYNNTTQFIGAAIMANGGVNTISKNVFFSNTSLISGILSSFNSTVIVENNIFYDNITDQGGVIHNIGGGMTISNNTIISNKMWGNSTLMFEISTNNIFNNIFYGNINYYGFYNDISNNNGSVIVSYCITQTYGTTGVDGNVVGTNPMFVDMADPNGADNLWGTADDGLRLNSCLSPFIDAATATNASATDILGNTRVDIPGVGVSAVDMGAYECLTEPVSSVTLSGSTSICQGVSALLNLSISGGGAPYVVTHSAGVDVITNPTLTVSPSVTTSYSIVSITDAYGCSTANISGSATVTVIPARIYVDGAVVASGNGQSWGAAYKTLQEGLDNVCTVSVGGEVWVKSGTYYPTKDPFGNTSPADNRDKTFFIPDNSRIYGGFAGTETALSQRNLSANLTILSGDLGTIGSNTDNAYHVVLASANSGTGVGITLDGFIITGGHGNGLTSATINGNTIFRTDGSGIYLYNGENTICNNIIHGNYCEYFGGGIFSYYGNNDCYNNILYSNVSRNGGGICAYFGSNSILNNTLYANEGTITGGGIYTHSGTNLFTNNIFWNNLKNGQAEVLGSEYYSSGTSFNSFFNNMMQLPLANYTITNSGNYSLGATAANGQFGVNPKLVNPTDPDGPDNIWRTADDGLQLHFCSPAIDAGTPTSAPARDLRGSLRVKILAAGPSNVDIGAYEQTTVFSATSAGSATICSGNSTNLAVTYSGGVAPYSLTYSGGTIANYTSGSAISVSPAATTQYTFSLTDAGGCAPMLTPAAATVKVLETKAYVDAAMSTSGNGTSWATAFKTLQEGLENVCPISPTGSEVWVKAGTYYPTKDHLGNASPADARTCVFLVPGNTRIYGGFAGTETSLSQRNILASPTILSGDIGVAGTTTDNCYHVVLAAASSATATGVTIDGFFITGGAGTSYSFITINENNVYCNDGSGIFIANGINILSNLLIHNNTCSQYGAGVYLTSGAHAMTNCLVFNNHSTLTCGGIYVLNGITNLKNCTIYGNSGVFINGGLLANGGTYMIDNTIFWNNKIGTNSTAAGADYARLSDSVSFFHCLMQRAASGYTASSYLMATGSANNLFAQDPLFINAADPDGTDNTWGTADDGLRLQCTSPAVNAGNNTGVSATDIVGNPRVRFGLADIGAYESAMHTPILPTALLSSAGVVLPADAECEDSTGWTHYFESTRNERLLSLKKNGNNIGWLGDGTFAVNGNTTLAWGSNTGTLIQAPYVDNPNGWYVMNRWWTVNPTQQPTTDVLVRSYFNHQDLADINGSIAGTANDIRNAQLKFYKINGPATDPNPANGHAGIGVASAYHATGYWEYNNGPTSSHNTWRLDSLASGKYYAEYTIASFSGGGGGGAPAGGNSNGAFPVEWLDFVATPVGEAVMLDWTTASEQNNASFTVERSEDGHSFAEIGTVAAIGNSTVPIQYSYTDSELPETATLYYRVRQTDIDGSASHSEIRSVTILRSTGIMVWPNPTTGALRVQVPANTFSLSLADESGRVLQTIATNGQAQQLSLNISDYAAGMYFLRVGTAVVKVLKH